MRSRSSHIRAWDALLRVLRFFYLLWGGMLLISLIITHRLKVPDFIWEWPAVVGFLSTLPGKALIFGVGTTMTVAALFEAWELVDHLLIQLLHEQDAGGDHHSRY